MFAVPPSGTRAPLGHSPNVPLNSEAFPDHPIIIATPFPGAPYLFSSFILSLVLQLLSATAILYIFLICSLSLLTGMSTS